MISLDQFVFRIDRTNVTYRIVEEGRQLFREEEHQTTLQPIICPRRKRSKSGNGLMQCVCCAQDRDLELCVMISRLAVLSFFLCSGVLLLAVEFYFSSIEQLNPQQLRQRLFRARSAEETRLILYLLEWKGVEMTDIVRPSCDFSWTAMLLLGWIFRCMFIKIATSLARLRCLRSCLQYLSSLCTLWTMHWALTLFESFPFLQNLGALCDSFLFNALMYLKNNLSFIALEAFWPCLRTSTVAVSRFLSMVVVPSIHDTSIAGFRFLVVVVVPAVPYMATVVSIIIFILLLYLSREILRLLAETVLAWLARLWHWVFSHRKLLLTTGCVIALLCIEFIFAFSLVNQLSSRRVSYRKKRIV